MSVPHETKEEDEEWEAKEDMPFFREKSIDRQVKAFHDERQTSREDAAKFIVSIEFCERLTYYGILSSLELFLRRELRQSTSQAVISVSIWIAFCYFAPLLGGWVADTRWGRFKTITNFAVFYFCSLFFVIFAALLEEHLHTNGTGTFEQTLFWMALGGLAIGTGGIKSNVTPLSADQFDENDPEFEKKKSSFFQWFYFSINCGSFIAFTAVALVCQDVSFSAGWSIALVALFLALLFVFQAEDRLLVLPPAGSVMSQAMGCAWEAWQRRDKIVDARRTSASRKRESVQLFLDRESFAGTPAARTMSSDMLLQQLEPHWLDMAKESRGGTHDDVFVEDVKLLFRLLPFTSQLVVFWATYIQESTAIFAQGCQMDYRIYGFKAPIGSLTLADISAILMLVPILQKYIFPALRARGIRVTPLRRMGFGYAVATFAMMMAGMVEIIRRDTHHKNEKSTCDGDDKVRVSSMSMFWLLPVLWLIGASEVFASIGSLDFFYTEAPDSMKSSVVALSLVPAGLGALLASLIVALVNVNPNDRWITNDLDDGHLEYYYFLLGGLMFAAFLTFLWMSSKYVYREVYESSYDLVTSFREYEVSQSNERIDSVGGAKVPDL